MSVKFFKRLVLTQQKDITCPLPDPLQFAWFWRMPSTWGWTISCNTLTTLGHMQGSCLWISAWHSTLSSQKSSNLNSPRSLCQLPPVSGQQIFRQARSSSWGWGISHPALVKSDWSPSGTCALPPALLPLLQQLPSGDLSVKLLKFTDNTVLISEVRHWRVHTDRRSNSWSYGTVRTMWKWTRSKLWRWEWTSVNAP